MAQSATLVLGVEGEILFSISALLRKPPLFPAHGGSWSRTDRSMRCSPHFSRKAHDRIEPDPTMHPDTGRCPGTPGAPVRWYCSEFRPHRMIPSLPRAGVSQTTSFRGGASAWNTFYFVKRGRLARVRLILGNLAPRSGGRILENLLPEPGTHLAIAPGGNTTEPIHP